MLDRCARLNAAYRLITRMLLTNKQRPSAREVLQEMKKRLSPERGSAHLTKLISHWRQRVSDKQFNRKPLGFSVKGILDESGRTSYELRADDNRLCVPWQWTQTAHNPDGWMGAFADDEAQRIRRFATGGPHVMNCFQHNRFNDPENIIVLCRNLYEHVHEHERMPFLADVADMDEMERDVRGANIGAGTRLHHFDLRSQLFREQQQPNQAQSNENSRRKATRTAAAKSARQAQRQSHSFAAPMRQ